ncbi:hypothetical protein O9993_01925 [Vibrio lentus]|nr:hypothetical protein [Vibrio lentus]
MNKRKNALPGLQHEWLGNYIIRWQAERIFQDTYDLDHDEFWGAKDVDIFRKAVLIALLASPSVYRRVSLSAVKSPSFGGNALNSSHLF